jgi:hypothetical protein
MRIEFAVDFGYRFLYSRPHYHPEYRWDGKIECTEGKILSVGRLTYSDSIYGPVHSPVETLLPSNEWNFTTHRDMAGVHVVAECSTTAGFSLITAQGTFTFSARQILDEGRIVFPVGSKYSHCTILVTRKGYLWFRPALLPLETVVEPTELKGVDLVDWSRMQQAWIDPAAGAEFELTLPEFVPADQNHWLFHLQGMTAKKPEISESAALDSSRIPALASKAVAADYIPMELYCDGRLLRSFQYYFRHHDSHVQMLQDVWARIPFDEVSPGRHQFRLVNRHPTLPLLVNRISIRPKTRRHLEMQTPAWALAGKEIIVSLYIHDCATPVQMEYDPRLVKIVEPVDPTKPMAPGLREIRLIPLAAGQNIRITVRDPAFGKTTEAFIPAVYDLPTETPEVKVGYDMTSVPHDDTGEMDWLLDYTHRTQLGNLVIFRPFTPLPIDGQLWHRWGKFCRDHQIYVQAVDGYQDGNLIAGAGDFFLALGGHELSMFTYYGYPDNTSHSMKESLDRYLEHFRQDIVKRQSIGRKIGYGDAGGGHRYTLMAGADFVRAETMVAHTMQHLSQCRPAAQAIGNGQWGVHIAIQHCKQPYLESHLGMYYLSLLQPWMMGASFLYEEDSLFLLFKEERQCWDDSLTKGKRDMTRAFFRFVNTHPRMGRPVISIGVILGRYAAPFNGFTCIDEIDASYSVWGQLGRTDPAWGHRQPEKAVQVMDVLMPGASTHPLRQRFDRQRFFFSGTPYGDFDQVPVEANNEFLSRYRLLMHLGWNTMTREDFYNLKQYVSEGGTLFLSVPHFSTHETRDFLNTMDDLALYADGRVRDLCGVNITGRGTRYSGQWKTTDPAFAGAVCPPLSRAPSVSTDEDGPCHLADVELLDARPVIVDALSQKPLLVEYPLGRGRVYLLTTWAYPGHEELADLSGAVVARLAERHMGEYQVDDPNRETFWTSWPQDAGKTFGKLMLLNTDWTEKTNRKMVTVKTPVIKFQTQVREREASIISYLPFGVIVPDNSEPHLEFLAVEKDQAQVRIHAVGRHQFSVFTPAPDITITLDGKPIPLTKNTGQEFTFDLTWDQSTEKDLLIQKKG